MNTSRVYGGQAVTDRRRERRERFLAAAVELFGTTGYTGTSVPQVCRAAGLSTRQFYQEFSDREDLLRTLYDQNQDRAMSAVATVVLERIATDDDLDTVLDAGVRAFVEAFDDPRQARIAFVEVVGVSPAFEEYRHSRRARWGELLQTALQAGAERGLDVGTSTPLQWTAYIGAVNSVIVERSLDPTIGPEQIVSTMRTLLRPGLLG
ncbi:putative TetR family transcriptional regulator [Gordonia hirsuta DSM 44140 = NBRC 16056]|uniref:Putative TetR family transcriptional regulator n=1 Tax=Gordonia hirsuta DSM 44140 = NBRC 16056 TaxID=1121927 RepID=L7L5W8_9ACTN|nr:TetR/AcrR family transcriptional regulator [Gordonia hirsuta]GAC56339.1 putative TetR family transcriptional regulator [Gordonia hirsuta DSM 44140 = NBRC 16056]